AREAQAVAHRLDHLPVAVAKRHVLVDRRRDGRTRHRLLGDEKKLEAEMSIVVEMYDVRANRLQEFREPVVRLRTLARHDERIGDRSVEEVFVLTPWIGGYEAAPDSRCVFCSRQEHCLDTRHPLQALEQD